MVDKLEAIAPTCTCGELKPGQGHRDKCPTLTSLVDVNGKPKIAPVQGYAAGIPWSLQLRAYDVYCAKWSHQAAMIDLDRRGCRGGFSVGELDDFIPGWRDEVSEITRLNAEVERLTAENARLSKAVCSGVLADLLSDDEAAALADFVKGLRDPQTPPAKP